jgi:salicylate synthetase
MCVKERGSVQHLASTVLGQLYPKTDAWTALNVLFPSITAAGIPKNIALEAIERLETRPRELYSGAVMLIDGKEDVFEATLCLRTLFQDTHGAWIQAGAGITSQSNPERELTETAEKLASVSPYIVYKETSSA